MTPFNLEVPELFTALRRYLGEARERMYLPCGRGLAGMPLGQPRGLTRLHAPQPTYRFDAAWSATPGG